MLWLGILVTAWARSFGLRADSDSYGCNLMTARYGCPGNNFGMDLRIRSSCYSPVPAGQPQVIMWWATQPNVTTDWTLRSGEGAAGSDPTTYIPNSRMPIYISAVKSGRFYEGLLMYAVNGNEVKVGDWEVPVDEDPDFITHPGITCSKSVMHATARYKRRVSQFFYLTPPAGTGPITFRVMWKDGQPNPTDKGGFWIPPANLTLAEAGASASYWGVVADGRSCDDYCRVQEAGCENPTGAFSANDLRQIYRVYPCDKAIFSECSAPGPRVIDNASRLCSFLDSNCTGRATPNPSCFAASTAAQPLLCKCGGDPSASPARAVSPQFLWVFMLGLVATWGLRNSQISTLLCLAGLLSMAEAHNWIEGTRGRARDLQASTVLPALPPVHPLKVDVQIYLGQKFQIEWATAHGGKTYFVVMHQSDEPSLSLNTEDALEDYIANAPSGSVHDGAANATDSLWQKFGRNIGNSTTDVGTGKVYRALISSGDPLFLGDRPTVWPKQFLASQGYQYAYNASNIATDRRVSYVSAKYPWIEAVHVYSNIASEVDMIQLTVPARKGAGRYIIHYIWSSYRDIYDIDVHTPPTPGSLVANPYGVFASSANVVYMQFDHCIFEGVQYLDQCWEAPTDAELARIKCTSDPSCKAYALVPIKTLPPWDNYTQLPFYTSADGINPGCNRTELLGKAPPDGMASYTITYFREFDNGAAPPWTIITDPDNIGFYSTCYAKLSPLQYDLAITSLGPTPQVAIPYRFGNKCIPCEDRGMNLTNGPRWRVADYCVDCDKEPANTKRNTNKIPAIATRTPDVAFNTDTNCQNEAKPGPCTQIKWITLGGSAWMYERECYAKVATTAGCSKSGAWLNGSYDTRYVTEWLDRKSVV